jgi:DNA segregation ATPase FtsK/SpoIIIE, S-DNA-T family
MIKLPVELPKIDDTSKFTLMIIGCFAAGILSYLSMFSLAGNFGSLVAAFLGMLFGRGSFVFPLGFFLAGILLIRIQSNPDASRNFNYRIFWGILLLILSINGFLSLFFGVETQADMDRGGGLVGYILFPVLFGVFGQFGASLLLFCVGLFGFFLISKITVAYFLSTCGKLVENPAVLLDYIPDFFELWKNYLKPVDNSKSDQEDGEKKPQTAREAVVYIDQKPIPVSDIKDVFSDKQYDIKKPKGNKINIPLLSGKTQDDGEASITPKQPSHKLSNWVFPPFDILGENQTRVEPGDIESNKTIISNTLAHFGIRVAMGDVYVGPTVTQYTLKPDNGVRLSAIDGLQRDLALSLAAPSIRIEAPISGQSLVGVEIPNKIKSQVRLRDIISDSQFIMNDDLPVVIGKDVRGQKMLYSLTKMPHLLVAGATGSGKSVWINGLLLSLLSKYTPYDLQLILVDMKRVELKLYEGVPHLLCPVITQADKSINALKWTVLEMDKRYELLEKHAKRSIKDYNFWVDSLKEKEWPGDEPKPEKIPYLVFIIDELGDLMMLAKSEVEPIIVRLTQMSRAVGIHVVLGTQRPDTHVVTGLIKANIPTRISFAVASQIDSRVILDTAGAEKLLGHGDGLIMSPSTIKPVRFQGALVDEQEVKLYVSHLKKQAEDNDGFTNFNVAVTEVQKTRINVPGMTSDHDETSQDDVFEEAKRIIVQYQKASTSFLQQMMGIGYPRAAKIINRMEEMGIIGPQNGSKPRDVYILPGEDL